MMSYYLVVKSIFSLLFLEHIKHTPTLEAFFLVVHSTCKSFPTDTQLASSLAQISPTQ